VDAIFAFAADRRTCRRHRVLKEGKIIIASQTGELPVCIRNLSATGAGLMLNRPQQVPSEFDLLLVTESLLSAPRSAGAGASISVSNSQVSHGMLSDVAPVVLGRARKAVHDLADGRQWLPLHVMAAGFMFGARLPGRVTECAGSLRAGPGLTPQAKHVLH
jgi:hypothetical protein